MRIGIDLGGTKIEALALDDEGVELGRRRSATPRNDYGKTIRAIVDHVTAMDTMVSGAGRRGSVGIGIPGAESLTTGLIKNANSVWLIGKPLAADLAAALGRPVPEWLEIYRLSMHSEHLRPRGGTSASRRPLANFTSRPRQSAIR